MSLSESAVSCFLRAVSLGQDLYESWIVCSAAAYVWNYYNHILQNNRNKEIVNTFQALLDGFKKVGHSGSVLKKHKVKASVLFVLQTDLFSMLNFNVQEIIFFVSKIIILLCFFLNKVKFKSCSHFVCL